MRWALGMYYTTFVNAHDEAQTTSSPHSKATHWIKYHHGTANNSITYVAPLPNGILHWLVRLVFRLSFRLATWCTSSMMASACHKIILWVVWVLHRVITSAIGTKTGSPRPKQTCEHEHRKIIITITKCNVVYAIHCTMQWQCNLC